MKHILFGQASYQVSELVENIEKGISALGGLSAVLGGAQNILLKPNMVLRSTREQAAMTDPQFVEAVIVYFKDHGIKVTLGDSPAFESAKVVARQNGIGAVCQKLDVPVVEFDSNLKGEGLWGVTSTLQKFDAVINLPKLKGHKQLYYTGAVKNLFGCVAGKKKFLHHMMIGDKDWLFGKMLLELAMQIKPKLTIMDGIVAMAGDGPLHGEAIPLGLMALSQDPIGLDLTVCNYLKADLGRLDIHQAFQLYFKDQELLKEMRFFNESVVDWPLFYFPSEKSPIRFSAMHAMRSVYKSFIKRIAG